MTKGIQIFPSGLEAMGPPDNEIPWKLSPGEAKLIFRLMIGLRLFWKGFISPIFNASAFFGFIAQAIGLAFLYALLGQKKLLELTTNAVVGITAFSAAMTCWAAIQAITAPFKIAQFEKSLGTWSGNRFIYKQAQHVFTKEWSPTDNETLSYFSVPDAIPDALVDYRIEIDGPAERLNCMVFGAYYFRPVAEMLKSARFSLHGRVRLRKDRQLLLNCLSMPDSVPAIIRVYILSWEINHSILLDYTDLRSDTRIVLGPP